MSEYYEHIAQEWPLFTRYTGERIVRCRDCVNLNIVGKCPCGFWALENLNGFCAWGERKEGGE